jgi:hypothetical protein
MIAEHDVFLIVRVDWGGDKESMMLANSEWAGP